MSKPTNTQAPENNGTPAPIKASPKMVAEIIQVRAKQLKEIQGPTLPDDDAFEARFPALWEFMKPATVNAAGKKWDRRAPTLSIQMDSGGWRITARDNDLSASVTEFSLTFDALLAALELAVCDPRRWVVRQSRSKGLKESGK